MKSKNYPGESDEEPEEWEKPEEYLRKKYSENFYDTPFLEKHPEETRYKESDNLFYGEDIFEGIDYGPYNGEIIGPIDKSYSINSTDLDNYLTGLDNYLTGLDNYLTGLDNYLTRMLEEPPFHEEISLKEEAEKIEDLYLEQTTEQVMCDMVANAYSHLSKGNSNSARRQLDYLKIYIKKIDLKKASEEPEIQTIKRAIKDLEKRLE